MEEDEEIIIDEEFKIINIGSELVIDEFQEISEDMICIICQNIVRNPLLCQECNGLFCYLCINKWNSSYPTCPACRKKFKEKFLPKNFLNIINKIKLLCQFSYKGCEKILKYEHFFQHIEICEFAVCKCISKECSFRDIRKNVKEHVKICIYVIEKCKYCDFKAMRLYINQHLSTCKYFPLYCQLCNSTIIRKNYPSHNDSKCLDKLNQIYKGYKELLSKKNCLEKQYIKINDKYSDLNTIYEKMTDNIEEKITLFNTKISNIEQALNDSSLNDKEKLIQITQFIARTKKEINEKNICKIQKYKIQRIYDLNELKTEELQLILSYLNVREIKELSKSRNKYLSSLILQSDFANVEIKSINTLKGHTNYVQVVLYLNRNINNKNIIATASWDKSIKIWDISTNKCIKTLIGHEKCINDIAYLYDIGSDGDILASGGVDDLILIWKINEDQSDQPINKFYAYCTFIYGIIYLNILGKLERDLIACCGQNATIKIFKAMSGECLQTIYGHFDYIFTIAHLEDYMEKDLDEMFEKAVDNFVDEDINEEIETNDYIVSGGNDYIIRVWKLDRNGCIQELSGHENTIRKIIYMRNFVKEKNDYICSCSTDNTIRIWRAIEGECLCSFVSHLNGVFSLAFLDDIKGNFFYIASGGMNSHKTLKIWKVELKNKQLITEYLNEMDILHQDSIRYLTFIYYKNKNILLSTSWDNNINIIDFYNL